MTIELNTALLIVDVQNDFCPGGALAVPDGDRVVGPLRELATRFADNGLPVIASRDWHPEHSRHFQTGGGPWPVHCVQESRGAAFHPGLQLPEAAIILSKGADPQDDGYSAFAGQDAQGRSLQEILADLEVRQLFVGGLATDYCVRATVLDALSCGLAVTILEDCIAGVEVQPGDSARALKEMVQAGAQLSTSQDFLQGMP